MPPPHQIRGSRALSHQPSSVVPYPPAAARATGKVVHPLEPPPGSRISPQPSMPVTALTTGVPRSQYGAGVTMTAHTVGWITRTTTVRASGSSMSTTHGSAGPRGRHHPLLPTVVRSMARSVPSLAWSATPTANGAATHTTSPLADTFVVHVRIITSRGTLCGRDFAQRMASTEALAFSRAPPSEGKGWSARRSILACAQVGCLHAPGRPAPTSSSATLGTRAATHLCRTAGHRAAEVLPRRAQSQRLTWRHAGRYQGHLPLSGKLLRLQRPRAGRRRRHQPSARSRLLHLNATPRQRLGRSQQMHLHRHSVPCCLHRHSAPSHPARHRPVRTRGSTRQHHHRCTCS